MFTLTCVNDYLLLTRKRCGLVVDKSILKELSRSSRESHLRKKVDVLETTFHIHFLKAHRTENPPNFSEYFDVRNSF